jgi:hypothetical protein
MILQLLYISQRKNIDRNDFKEFKNLLLLLMVKILLFLKKTEAILLKSEVIYFIILKYKVKITSLYDTNDEQNCI